MEGIMRARWSVPGVLVASVLATVGCDSGQDGSAAPSTVEQSASEKESNARDLGTERITAARGGANLLAAATTSASIPFAPEPGPFASLGPACDDCVLAGQPIGFTFRFFG